MRTIFHSQFASLLLLAGLLLLTVEVRADCSKASTLRTVEGRVVSLGSQKGEGDLELLTVDLAIEGNGAETMQLMLAPKQVFDDIGFSISEGDRLRARVFADPDEPIPVHKVENLSRGTTLRLRTLHKTPLWSATGSWQGSTMRNGRGPHRHGYRGGQGPAR